MFIRCIIIGGPFDVYYMVIPEAKGRQDPDDRAVMRYGFKVGVALVVHGTGWKL